MLERKPQKAAEGKGWNSKILPIRLDSRPGQRLHRQRRALDCGETAMAAVRLDLDDVAVGIKREELGKPGRAEF